MIRDAATADVEAVVGLEREALGADAWSAGLLEEGVTGRVPTVQYLVAEADGQVVGYAAASLVAEVAELQRVAVAVSHRRRGIAAALLAEMLARARGEGAERMLLEVRETNGAALACYAAAGFVEIHRRPRYYHDGSAALVLGRTMVG